MTQTRKALIFSKDEAELHEVQRILRDVPGISLYAMPGARVLDGTLALPFIEVDDAERFFGFDSIRRFAQRLMASTNGA